MDQLLIDAADDIGTIQLNRPERRNALSGQLMDELVQAIDAFQAARVRVVVLRSAAGSPVWSAGHDVRELPLGERDPIGYADPLEKAIRAIRRCPAPVIAMVHGSVWGGATDLALSCDLIVGDETSSFAITPVNLGLPYNASGILNVVNRVGEHMAKEMFFTAAPLDAQHAARVGILNHLVASGELEQLTYELARRIATKSPLAVSVIKEQIRVLTQARPIPTETFERIEALRATAWASRDYREGINAFFEKRSPNFVGE